MRTVEATRKPAATIQADGTITEAARLMNERTVGALVVLDGERPVGIVADRDLVLRALARALPPGARVDGVMTADPLTVDGGADLRDAYRSFANTPSGACP
ncbi:MAG: CBS domain-containing protein [Acidimicrobiia bacterium]|nr:CBS domain-containing protein [Acidimicrobiia bacterium]